MSDHPPADHPPAVTPPLTAADWAQVSAWFETGRDMPADARAAWLAGLQLQHPALAPWLRAMLDAHANRHTHDWLERGPQVSPGALDDGPQPGQCIGPWRLEAPLGSGGMATVWRAHRADALPARRVALKLPLAQPAGSAARRQLAERFAREQAILARLEHPHIARLYDAGVADDGTPWLAMELVEGQRIDVWCDARHLGVAARLQLFAQVLDAVQDAHARLVLHRDLKPANILVTADGQVRLLDFGIARLLDGDGPGTAGADASALTQAGQRVMTPAYAAPEQVLGLPLTTAADQYALGVVLFELLAGRGPYRLAMDSPAQLEQAVAGAQVQQASGVVDAGAAARRGCSLRTLRRQLAGDLDNVLAQALAASPPQRYASVAAFADDLAAHRAGRPIAAQRGSLLVRLRKWTGRHRLQAGAAAAVLAAVTAGTGLALWQAGVARQERNAARAEADRSNALNFFWSDLLEQTARSDAPINGPQLVARTEALARSEFKDRPDELAAVLVTIAMLHNADGERARARALFEEALAVVRDPAFRQDVRCDLAAVLDDGARALALLTTVADAPALSARSRAGCLVYLGDLLRHAQPAEARRRYMQALQEWGRPGTGSPYDRITIQGRLAYAEALLGHTALAQRAYETAQADAAGLGRDGPGMGAALRNRLGRVLLMADAPAAALPLFSRNLDAQAQARPGSTPPAETLLAQGMALLDLGRTDDARQVLQAAAAAASAAGSPALQAQSACLAQLAGAAMAVVPATPDPTAQALCTLAQAAAQRSAGDWAAADRTLSGLLARPLPEPHWAVEARLQRAEARARAGQQAAAADDARWALDEARRLQDGRPDGPRSQRAQALLAQLSR